MFNKYNVRYIPLTAAFSYTGTETRYYIRGKKIGFVPMPSGGVIYNYIYLSKTSRLGTNSELVDLPDNGFYAIKDWMMYRARLKFQDLQGAGFYLKTFTDNVDAMIISAIDRDANLDSWGATMESIS